MISEWRSVWLVVIFDLPTTTRLHRFHYQRFRNILLTEGFRMLQYSVYGRHCATRERVEAKEQRVTKHLPPEGEVRILTITDSQFARMRIFESKLTQRPEKAPQQLEFW